jgi:hypothetical protein
MPQLRVAGEPRTGLQDASVPSTLRASADHLLCLITNESAGDSPRGALPASEPSRMAIPVGGMRSAERVAGDR